MESKFESAWNKMIEKLGSWIDSLVVNIPNIIIAIIVFFAALILSKYVSKLALKLLERTKLQDSMKNLVAKLVSMVVVLMGLFLILGILDLGKALNTILAGAGVVGLAIGLALQGALANTYAGIVLSYIKHIKFGDWIESSGFEGEVVSIDLRAVTLKQPDNNIVYIPNKVVLENPLKNFSTTAQSRVILECGVGYESNLRDVQDLVVKTISSSFKAVANKEDVIFIYKAFGDSSINFETRFWINSTSAIEVARAKTKAMIEIKEAFDKDGINIPFPIRTLDFPKEFFDNKNAS